MSEFGKYTLVERLGRGGMAEVWKAELTGPGGFARPLVLKRILPALADDERFVHMFEKEARLLARLNHPNIVQVFEFGEIDGRYYLTMELVDGHDMAWLLSGLVERGLPPIGFAPFVVREVCRALAYAHALTDENGRPLRLIHRDISPSNIMVDHHGGVKLLDFGVAKALAEATQARTQTGVLKGKLWYMAPERLDEGDFDHRADLFAAGCVLFEGLTGRRLFTADTPIKIFKQVSRVRPPSDERRDVPPALDRVCMRALAISPDERYQTAEEMGSDLDAVLREIGYATENLKQLVRALTDEPLDDGVTAPQIVDRSDEIRTTNVYGRRDRAPEPPAATVVARKLVTPTPRPVTPAPVAADDPFERDATTRSDPRRVRSDAATSLAKLSAQATTAIPLSRGRLALTWPPPPLVWVLIAIGMIAGFLLLAFAF